MRALIDRYVAERKVSGAVVGFVTPGRFAPSFLTAGETAFGSGISMDPDTLFRIYSMTKPITGMAVMQQVAAGRMRLDQPVAEIAPAYRDMGVLIDPAKGLDARPARAPMLIRHLLTHTAGLSYHIAGKGPLESEYRRQGLMPGVGRLGQQPGDGVQPDLQGFVDRLARLPLRSDPGETWFYSVALDLAGGLLERVAGKPLDRVFSEQLFGPLGMTDSFFQVPPGKLARLSANYLITEGKPVLIDSAARSDYTAPPPILAGGAGLVSSTRDYARFIQMLLNEGRFEGRIVMPRETVRLAMSNLLPASVFFQERQGYGAGGRVVLTQVAGDPEAEPQGLYGWGGAAGTAFMVDPARRQGVVLMVQFMPTQTYGMTRELRRAVNEDWAAR